MFNKTIVISNDEYQAAKERQYYVDREVQAQIAERNAHALQHPSAAAIILFSSFIIVTLWVISQL